MNDEQNLKFMNHPERLKAEDELKKALKNIRDIQTLSAQTVLIYMPPALKRLEEAYENLNILEAKLEQEGRQWVKQY